MQIVGYDAGVGGLRYDPVDGTSGEIESATLLLADDGDVRSVPLDAGTELAFTLGGRHCAGAIDDGRHEVCVEAAAPYCADHTSTWLCAQCRGGCDLPLPSCREEHAVYMAAFAPDRFKVGVTRRWRLVARLREQGADRAALLRVVSDGRLARTVEASIAETVADRIPVRAKVAGMDRRVDEDAWESLLADFDPVERFDVPYGLDLVDRPVAETLATGTVRGTKGRLLVLEYRGSTFAVDMRDLVGHDVSAGATDRDLQANLGAFS